MNSQAGSPSASAKPDWADQHRADRRWADYRICLAVLGFYLLDAVMLALFCANGVGSWVTPLCFALTGLLVAGGGAVLVRRFGAGSLDDPRLVVGQAGSAVALTLAVAMFDPAFMALMVLTVIVIIPTAALRITPRGLLPLCVVAAAATLAVVAFHGGRIVLPTQTPAQLLLSGLFLLWTIAKGASVNAAGMALRLELDESHQRLTAALARVEQLAEHDELTGLPNRRRMLAALAEERERQARSGVGYAVAMLDLDHFKAVNDRHGHPVGDEVLRAVAQLMRGALRTPDLVGRMGGEEFLIILPGADSAAEAKQAAERVRAAIAGRDWSQTADELQVTASIGLAVGTPGEPVECLIARADRGLYRAKNGGRNRVATEPPGPR